MIEKLTTTEDFTETTTAFVTEIDFKTTTNEANDNGDLPTALPANFEILTTQCTEHHVKFICLNGGTCIRFQMPNEESLLTCKCSDGYLGERCENLDTSGKCKKFYLSSHCPLNDFLISAKVIEINITVFNSGRQQQLDSNSSAAFQVPFAFLAVIISFIGFQMLSN